MQEFLTDTPLLAVFPVLLGLLIGSFLSVCIYRIPLGRGSGLEELVGDKEQEQEQEQEDTGGGLNSKHFDTRVTIWYPPRSFCPACGEKLRWWHNIPLFSWLLLGGTCAFCKARISARYPLVELLSAAFCYFSFALFPIPTAIVIYFFSATLIVLSFIDLDYFILPNVITYPSVLVGLILAAVNHLTQIFTLPLVANIWDSLIGLLVGGGILLAISEGYMRLRKKQGLGMGDVKLLAVTGAFFGVPGAIYTIFIGSLLGSVIGIALIIIGRGKFSNYLPFGPYLAAANLLYIFTGSWLLIEANRVLVMPMQWFLSS